MMLRRIFGPKRDQMTGGLRKLHNEKLHDSYLSPSIIRIIKCRRMVWAGGCSANGREEERVSVIRSKASGKEAVRIGTIGELLRMWK
jgi:hypothetical protein